MKLRKKILLTAGLIGITTPIMAETSYQCLNCPAGTYSVAGATSCTKCPAGKYSTGGTSTCLSCPVGTYSKAGASSCISCLNHGVAACDSTTGYATSCKVEYGLSTGTCDYCSSGYYSNGGSKACSNKWTLYKSHTNPGYSSGTLNSIGYYKIVVNGPGGSAGNGYIGDRDYEGGSGGNGEQKSAIFYTAVNSLKYTYNVGRSGRTSSFYIDTIADIVAESGNPGESASSWQNGAHGSDAGNGQGGKGGIGSYDEDGEDGENGSVYIYRLSQ